MLHYTENSDFYAVILGLHLGTAREIKRQSRSGPAF
ncbi:hypothetical protein SDC9_188036 [bioreactor metagenome]|uniref:Uncharacterized protein n=1 Tax=bioreactor metagenome TaxID=1076179 RepID=A0A645HN84_9ZZZZ